MTEAEAEALAVAGFTLRAWDDEARDPLIRSAFDFVALLDSGLTVAEAAKRLDVDSRRIRQRLQERSLMGIRLQGQWRLPLFQFEKNRVRPGFEEILPQAPLDLAPQDLVEWFLLPNAELEVAPRKASETAARGCFEGAQHRPAIKNSILGASLL